jgi:hypothetical protein
MTFSIHAMFSDVYGSINPAFSIEVIADRPKSARTKAQASQLWISIIHVPGNGLGVAIMIARCTLGTQRMPGSL